MASLRDRLRGIARRTDRAPLPPDVEPADAGLDAADTRELPAAAPARPLGGRALRAERQALDARYDALRDDLGGMLLEMGRRAQFNHPLLERRATEAAVLEARLVALGGDLAVAEPLLADAQPAPRACDRCGATLATDANFCAYCGTTVLGR